MLAGDVVRVDFSIPAGSEPGFECPAVVVTADAVLAFGPRTLHVVPLTSNVERRMPTEVEVAPEDLGTSMAQCHLCTVVSTTRIHETGHGNIGVVALAQIRGVLSDLLDLS